MPRNYDAELHNPCLKEQELTYKCLNQNHFDRQKCEFHFVNYNNCKEFWMKVRADRRSKSIKPELPPIEEREALKAKYMSRKPSN